MDNGQPLPATPALDSRVAERSRTAGQWYRFWKRMLLSALVFNVVAGLVTWFFLFPRLFPGR